MLHGGASYPGGALLRVGVSPQDGGSSRNERSCPNIGSAGEDVRIAGQSSGGTADVPAFDFVRRRYASVSGKVKRPGWHFEVEMIYAKMLNAGIVHAIRQICAGTGLAPGAIFL